MSEPTAYAAMTVGFEVLGLLIVLDYFEGPLALVSLLWTCVIVSQLSSITIYTS
jgi:hypothetical protein